MEFDLKRIEELEDEKRQTKIEYEAHLKAIEDELTDLGVYDLPDILKVGDFVYDKDRNKYLITRITAESYTIECLKELRDADGNITSSYKLVESIDRENLTTISILSTAEIHHYYHPDRIDYELWKEDYLARHKPKTTVKKIEN